MASNRPLMKLDTMGDSRLIPGGLWVRALGLDELPQIFNVLRGEMSLVGPASLHRLRICPVPALPSPAMRDAARPDGPLAGPRKKPDHF